MIKIVWNALLLAAVALSAAWLSNNPGTVTIRWIGYEIETSVAVLLVCALTVYAVFYAFLAKPALLLKNKLSYWIGGDRRAERLARGKIEKEIARHTLLGDGMTALAAGDVETARKMRRSIDRAFADDPKKTLVFKAQLAEAENNAPEALRFYEELAAAPETRPLGLRGQIRLYGSTGETRKALALCEPLLNDGKPYLWVFSDAFALQVRDRQWTAALETLNKAQTLGAVDRKTARRVKAALLLEAAKEQTDADERKKLIAEAESADDAFPPAVLAAADVSARDGAVKKALSKLKRLWKTAPDLSVYKAYEALLPDRSPAAVLKAAQELTGENKAADINALVLSDASLKAGLPEQAKGLAEKYLENHPSSKEALLLAAAACAAMNDEQAAAGYGKKAENAPSAPADVPNPFVRDPRVL